MGSRIAHCDSIEAHTNRLICAMQRFHEGSFHVAHRLLFERAMNGYVEHNPFFFFFGQRGNGAICVVYHHENSKTYNVLVCKSNNYIGTVLLSIARKEGMSEDKIFDYISKYAEQKSVLKKVYRNLSEKDFKIHIIQKEGLNLSIFEKVFPHLANISSAEGGGAVSVEGMSVIGLEAFKKTEHILKAIKRAADLLRKNGFAHLLYGEIYVIGGAMSRSVAADYSPTADKIRFKANERDDDEVTKTMLHELGHRQNYKFKVDQKAIDKQYWEARSTKPIYKPGTVFFTKKGGIAVEITGVNYNRAGQLSYSGFYSTDPQRKTLVIPPSAVASGNILKGETPKRSEFHVSEYAMTNEREFFAEVFAFGIIKNDATLIKWIKSVT